MNPADLFSTSTLWMGNLEKSITDEQFITQAFAACGEPASDVAIIRNKRTGQVENFCFIEFQNAAAARRARLRLDGKNIPNTIPPRKFRLNFSSLGREEVEIPVFPLHVSDLTDEVDDWTLYSAFAVKYKSTISAKVVTDDGGRSLHYGFVRFTSQREQHQALMEMNHAAGIGKRLVKVGLALPKKLQLDARSPRPQFSALWQKYRDKFASWQHYYAVHYQHPHEPESDEVHTHNAYYDEHPEVVEQQRAAQQQMQEEVADEMLEDPHVEIDVDAANLEFMTRSEELCAAVDEAQFYPVDDLSVKLDSVPGV